jgi:hypothetical protein
MKTKANKKWNHHMVLAAAQNYLLMERYYPVIDTAGIDSHSGPFVGF